MKRVKKPVDQEEGQFLATRAELLELLRDPDNLGPVQRFCQILWARTPRGENKSRYMGIFIQAVADGGFPKWALEGERERQEARTEASKQRRFKRLAVA